MYGDMRFLWLAGLLACAGCDKETKLDKMLDSGPPPAASPAPLPSAEPPKATALTVDDTGFVANGTRADFTAPDFKGRVTALLASTPKIEGESLQLEASRKAPTQKVALVARALAAAKAKDIAVKTPTRDRVPALLPIASSAPPSCSAAGYINKDVSVAVWTAGGGTATRFTKGFAGPDLTLGSEAMRKASGACDSGTFYIGADESITWGLAFDLAMAARTSEAGPARATTAAFLPDNASPGRPVR
jgi:hypothetical protein